MNQPAKSSPLKWIGIGCGVLVLLGACIAGGCVLCAGGITGTVLTATEAPAQAAHGFFADVRTQNWQQAHARMSATYQSTHTPETLQMAAAQIPALAQQTDSTFTNRNVNAGGATMSGTLTTPSGSIPVEVTLSSQGGNWYVETVTVQGMPLQ